MNYRRKMRLASFTFVLMLSASAIGLILYALNQNLDFFYMPEEVIYGRDNGQKPEIGQRIRVGGLVKVGSVSVDDDSLKVSFDLIDVEPKYSITVLYDGLLPDLFREGQGIIAQGTLIDRYTVEAKNVLAKHDENYMPPEVAKKTAQMVVSR